MNRKDRRTAEKKAARPAGEAALAAAMQHHRAGQFAEAAAIYRGILATNPRHALSLYHLGLIELQSGRPRAAVSAMAAAVAIEDGMPEWHYHLALACQSCGQIDDAIRHYGRAIVLKPDYAEPQTNLGIALQSQGRMAEALTCYERALELQPHSHLSHYNFGMALAAQGRAAEAERSLLAALALKDDFSEAHNNLGMLLVQQGRAEDAAARYRRALAANPNMAEAHLNIGNLLREQGRLDEAAGKYRDALALRPDFAEALNNLGSVALAQGRPAEAGPHFQHALRVRPAFHEALLNLCRVLLAEGEPEQALSAAMDALAIRETTEAKALFVRAALEARRLVATDELRRLMERALCDPWDRPANLAVVAAELVRQDPQIAACMVRAANAWPMRLFGEELFGAGGPAALARDRLLPALLRSAPVPLVAMERLLTATRSVLVGSAAAARADDTAAPEVLELYGALAENCFINGYVFDIATGEPEQVQALRDRIGAGLRSGDGIPALWVLGVAAFMPLHALPGAQELLGRPWPPAVQRVLRQQVQEPLEEQAIRERIPRLTAIDDDVSRDVQRQYEEDPYPAWVRTLLPPAIPVGRYLKRKFFDAAPATIRDGDRLDMLVAGCGTGQQVVEMAQQFAPGSMLAVDLSLASLGRAQRMVASLGIERVAFAQADILRLGSIGRTFDLIVSTGVLHHMADPLHGWRVLLSLLRPRGLMLIGLYSELARQDVVAARTRAAAQGVQGTADGIRRFRQELIGLDPASPLRSVTAARDFFSLSECRDLLLHVQEHRFTIPQIKSFLDDNNLRFIGFEPDSGVRQAGDVIRHSGDAMTDLDRWHAVETNNPRTFPGMYQFWVQKHD